MTKQNQIYKCNICGNIIEILHEGAGELVCCNQSMNLIKENTQDAATEKHIPIIEKTGNWIKITVGEIEHPMTEDHFIEWIEVISKNTNQRKNLNPNDKPIAEFCIQEEIITVKAYCNLHWLWKS